MKTTDYETIVGNQKIAVEHLGAVLEWAKGNRGRKDVNPYGVPEVEAALRHLAHMQGREDWLDVDTKKLARGR